MFGAVLSAVAWWPMLSAYPHTQMHDSSFFHKMIEVTRVSITRYHELPLWNPFECGGVALWDNPQGVAAAPLVWLTLLVGTTRTMELWYFFHSIAGVLCMWCLARLDLRMSMPASLVAAAAWSFAGVHHMHFTGGHFVWVPYLYFPLALFLWRRAETQPWYGVGLGFLAALAMYEGGTYPLPYLATLLGAETLFRVWPPRRFLRILRAALVVFVVALAVGAPRFFPVWDQLSHHHRDIAPDFDAMTTANLKDIFLARDHGRGADGQQYVWPEFGAYVGPILLALAAIGALSLGVSELWLLVLFALSFALMCGHFSTYAPWSVLNKYVYPFKQMRVPSRFVVMTSLFMAIFAGFAVDRLPQRLRRMRSQDAFKVAIIGLAFIGIGDEISVGRTFLASTSMWSVAAMVGAPQEWKRPAAPRLYLGPPIPPAPPPRAAVDSSFIDAPYSNIADLHCWEEWAFERDAPLWLGDVPQAKSTSIGVTVTHVDRTTNTFTVDLVASGPGRVLLNSTYDRGWRTDHGEVVADGKMLAVDVPSGTYKLRVRYWPHGLTAGFVVAAVATVGLAILFVRHRRRARAVFARAVAS